MRTLIHFFDEWTDFRIEEFHALLEMLGVEGEEYQLSPAGTKQSFVVTTLPSAEVAMRLCERAVLVRAIYELWAQAPKFEELVDAVKHLPEGVTSAWTAVDKSWCIEVNAYCRTVSHADKEAYRQALRFLDFRGDVVINNPDVCLAILLDFSASDTYSYFGRLVARGGQRDELRKYDLKKRIYLGPTSLDHELALLMGNLAGCTRGSTALDPFVGTASILVALSHFGARCTGFDIDVRVLKGAMYAGAGRHPPEPSRKQSFLPGIGHFPSDPTPPSSAAAEGIKRDIFETFRAYGLPVPELVRMDLHLLERHIKLTPGVPGADTALFDVIVTDPPYGIRAGGRKSGKTNGCTYSIAPEARMDHIPSTQNYPVEEVMLDLLHAAVLMLRVGGALCYLIPTSYDFGIADLPQHPCLALTRLCHQGLSTRHGRHCVVMRKTRDYDATSLAEFLTYKDAIISASSQGAAAAGFGQLIGKLERALASGSFEDTTVVKAASKSALKRKESSKARREAATRSV